MMGSVRLCMCVETRTDHFYFIIFCIFFLFIMSSEKIVPPFTTAQREFMMERLANDIPYADIISDFKRKHPQFCLPFSDEDLDKKLNDRLRTLKSQNKEKIAALSENGSTPSVLWVTDDASLLGYLQDLLEKTPEVEVTAEGVDHNGNPYKKFKSNRPDICKIIGQIRSITNPGGAGGGGAGPQMPRMATTKVMGTPPDQSGSKVSDANS